MTTRTSILIGAALLLLALAGCSPDDPEQLALDVTQPSGPEALSRYVAIGNSLTAGFMDGGLIMSGQMSSFPVQIAAQLGYELQDPTSDDWFAQPLVAWPGIGSTELANPAYTAGVLHWDGTGIAVRDSTELAQVQGQLLLAAQHPTPYHNLGVPGATLTDVTEALDSGSSQQPGNAFFDFVLRNPNFGDIAMLDQAIARGPTLATVWIGNNDVLGGATSGEPELGVNVLPAAAFAQLLEGVIAGLIDGVSDRFGYEPHLVVGDIPAITSVPYFVPKAVFDAAVGAPYPTVESDVTHVLFPALGLVQGGFSDPLPETQTLTGDEAQLVLDTAAAYNDAIDDLAATYGFTVAGVDQAFADLTEAEKTHFVFLVGEGMPVEQAAQTTVFSLDGIHPNNVGHSRVANVFIEAINTELGLTGEQALVPVPDAAWDPTYPPPAPAGLAAAVGH
jgi:lysophospholipase L1-like esterase